MGEIIVEKHLDDTYEEALSNRIALSVTAISLNEISNKEHTLYEHIKEIRSYLSDDEYTKHCRRISIKYMPFAWKTYIVCAKLKLAIMIYSMTKAMIFLRKR